MKICQYCRKAREPGSLSLRKELEELSHRNGGGGGVSSANGDKTAQSRGAAGSSSSHHLVPIQIFDVGYGREWKPSRLVQQLQNAAATGGEKSRSGGRGKHRPDEKASVEVATTVENIHTSSSSSSAEHSSSHSDADLNLWSIGSLSMWNSLAPAKSASSSQQHQPAGGEVGSSGPVLTLTLPSHTVWFDEDKADKEYSNDY
jgi:hypothetical protein